MLFVGLTGGIGSGKSTVSSRLTELGAVVIDADRLAREVVEPGAPGLAQIAKRFGDEVLQADGTLDRPALGAIVFADPEARRDLERITHPRIAELTAQARAAAPREAIVVHDMPLLVETGLAANYDLVLIVDASEQVRLDRLVRDRGMAVEDARARIAAQATDEQRRAVADVVLDNNGTREQLLAQVDAVWRERLAPYNAELVAKAGEASGS
ncbi:dephospho-CoA kinase [Flexivirga meconopsidis]|uniref:dephospho-CoA kinase n=1 Tax=Flexivirga meconopsidis TaxID=2977121 RepID=UPI0022403F5D